MGTALITGASEGIGLEFAWQLAEAQHNLVLVARRRQKLEEIAAKIHNLAGVKVEVLAADLSTQAGVDAVAERIRSTQLPPTGLLVNNAGFGLGQSFIDGDMGRELDALNVMVRAVMELSRAATDVMIPRGHGAILNVASVAARTVMGTYSAHKAWVATFTESLSTELAGTGVTATVLLPGLTRSGFHAAAHIDDTQWPKFVWLESQYLVSQALDAVRKGRVYCVPSLRYALSEAVLRRLPRCGVRYFVGASRVAATHY